MIIRPNRTSVRRTIAFAFFVSACACLALLVSGPLAAGSAPQATLQHAGTTATDEPMRQESAEVAAFRQAVGGAITPLMIELKADPGVVRKAAAEREGETMSVQDLMSHSRQLLAAQDGFIAGLAGHGVRALPREALVPQIDGSVRHIRYRLTYLLNGFVAYVADEDIDRLRALPEVAHVSVVESPKFALDQAIDYSLGTQTNAADRRNAVYGATHEFTPSGEVSGHPEAPRTAKVDGFEGQNMKVAVIDSGVDWRHPMFGGTGHTTPLPRVSGQPENPQNNRKVIYYYAVSSPGDPADDFGHGTHVASCVAGFSVDGDTPPQPGYGLGKDGTGVGPTINNAQLFGTAPQAQIMAYKVCGPATNCFGDIELAMEDAASPVTIVGTGDGGTEPTMATKPIADVINLSLSGPGDPAGSLARVANNAALSGTIVVASASNDGPGASTLGAPCVGTLPLCVAASFDPGSTNVADVLAPDQITGETRTPATPGPPAEQGAASQANAPQPGERQAMKLFPVSGGGPLPEGSLSAHYVFVDRRGNVPPAVPPSVTNRIALIKGSGTFASQANAVAPFNPAAILIITSVESATAVQVLQGIPTYTIGPADGNYLIDRMLTGDEGDGDDNVDVPVGTISELPLRLADSATLATFQPGVAGFSSRGPVAHDNGRFRMTKPDVTAPGVGILGAATVEGIPEETVGMASLRGYISVNGTSFSAPITAGAMALVRQYVRETLLLDETDSAEDREKENWRERRFNTVTVAKALIMNTATNLRSGFGVPQGDGAASVASILDMGAGHINIAAALQGRAIMVAPTQLLQEPEEFSSDNDEPITVMVPSVSFGPVPIVNVNGTITRTREVVIRDVSTNAGGGGSGVYNLTTQNNRNTDNPGFQISFTDAEGAPLTSVTVPAGGEASFFVRVVADGNVITADPTEFQWYVTAASATQTLRMPFYYRAVKPIIPNITAPEQQALENTQEPSPTPEPKDCSVFDTDGNYTVKWTYTRPADGPNPVGFRVQEATRSVEIFFDDANEPMVNGDNSTWTGSDQWNSSVNPETGSLAYYVPDAANQNESITSINPIQLPSGGATLSFDTNQDTEEGFDFAHVELSVDGVNYVTVASFSGFFAGTRSIDISPYAGQSVKLRFRMASDLVVSAPGWWVENIRVSSDNYRRIADVGPETTSLGVSGRFNGTYFYRIAGLFTNPIEGEPIVTGPYSNVQCVTVTDNPLPAPSHGALRFSSESYAVGENGTSVTIKVSREGGTDGRVTVDYATSDGSATAGADYTAAAGTLEFNPGEASKQFTVQIADDAEMESDETVNLTLTNPTEGATLGTASTAVLTIIDNDTTSTEAGTLQFSAANYSEAENAGAVTITVTRTGGSTGTVTVSYATSDGSADANSDYTPTSGILTFAPGEVTRNFSVTLFDDPSAEPDEAFIVKLSNATGGATLGSRSSATVTILDTDRSGPPAQLLNISTRLRVRGGDNVGIGGFIITGDGTKRIIVRGIGPSLSSNGEPVEGRLQDPVIELFDGNGGLITSNDNWKDSPERAEIESSGLAPQNDAEAAIARTLNPGAYTAMLYGKDQSEGIGLVEVYDRDQGGTSEMANISTRGVVDTGNNVLIGGFIAGARSGATNVVVRAIGPSLTDKGVPDALQDPTVELVNNNGETLVSNDDWKTSPDQGEVAARGLAPQDDRESAAFHTLAPGNYTVIVRGKSETTGVGLVEIYNVH